MSSQQKLVFAQVFDETAQRWVLRKVPEMTPKKQQTVRRVRIGQEILPPRDATCLVCLQAFRYHFHNQNGFITCERNRTTNRFFEWYTDV